MTAREIPAHVASLWPAPARLSIGRSSTPGATAYLAVPSMRRPRLLMPTDVPNAHRMLHRHGGSWLDRAARLAFRRAHRSGLTGRLPVTRLSVSSEPGGIEAYLSEAVDQAVRIGVLLGPPRANLKPVVQLFSAAGETIAFAKVGVTTLSQALVENEAWALEFLASQPTATFEAPTLLHRGVWRGLPVVVQAPLSLAQDAADRTPAEPPLRVMVEIAALGGISQQPLASSDLISGPATDDADWHGIDLEPIAALGGTLRQFGDVPFGAWHGDFGPWNMGVDGSRVQVWDWERFALGVPVGFDAAHYQVQRGVAAGADPVLAWHRIVADVRAVHAALGLDDTAGAVGAAYLLAIVARYRHDAADGPTPALRRRLTWLAQVASVARGQAKELSR
jgi:hypothetical protein